MADIDAALARCDADNPVFYEDEVDIDGIVAQISQQVMTFPAPSNRYIRGFLKGRPRVFSLLIAPTYAITSPT